MKIVSDKGLILKMFKILKLSKVNTIITNWQSTSNGTSSKKICEWQMSEVYHGKRNEYYQWKKYVYVIIGEVEMLRNNLVIFGQLANSLEYN